MSTPDERAHYARQEQADELRERERIDLDERRPGDRLCCPHCNAYELAIEHHQYDGLEVVIGKDGQPEAIISEGIGDDGDLVVCQGCSASWHNVEAAAAALILHPYN